MREGHGALSLGTWNILLFKVVNAHETRQSLRQQSHTQTLKDVDVRRTQYTGMSRYDVRLKREQQHTH